MDELEGIRRRKLEELKKQQLNQVQEDQQMRQQVQQLKDIVKQVLTKEALERYGNLKTAYPDRAVQLIVILAQAIQSGQVTKIDDSTLKQILKKITPEKKEFRIN